MLISLQNYEATVLTKYLLRVDNVVLTARFAAKELNLTGFKELKGP